ncbi:MAG: hypothetical protein H6865_03330 [Rhodospirillales bacterium]|nr:hypothetical protein [Alphaproteobacteria bacterium]MCB9986649.1 hypothetical protein [Rhodospirillales bacterium]USO06823.1 MAG: hypothetical protein H6866_05055 [Rhodospirillales bacterium]
MQIDLLASQGGELGLVANHGFEHDVSVVIFDLSDHSLTLEFGQAMDSLRLNVAVSGEFTEPLRAISYLHVCAVEKGRMVYAKQVPMMKVSTDQDDYFAHKPIKAGIMPLQTWLKNAKFAQSVHRDNLGDSTSNGGIIHREGLSAATLQVAPQLAQLLVQEQALAQKVQLHNMPRLGMPSLGPGTQMPQMGLNTLLPRTPNTPQNGDDNS